MTKFEEIYQLKLKIAYNTLSYIKTKEKNLKLAALSDLKTYSEFYDVKVGRVLKIDTMDALILFLNPVKGVETINKLYNSL